ncbi:MAG: exodeoxyribonuclease VII large subunit [Ideonella sp.]|nr:exodeoxyribonuclease VII large subunit [Ideonella sp.]
MVEARPAAADAPAGRGVWSVAALVAAIADSLAARFAACTVVGEISGFTRAASGHCYFSLKDADGQAVLMRCAMFRRAAVLVDFTLAEGQRVEVRGRVAVYEPRGELQFIVEAMRRAGAGTLYEQFLQLKARLGAEGLFDAERKRALPRFARRVGVVTSLAGAALHDVASAMARRAPQVELIVYPSPVQGADAPAALVGAIAVAALRAEVDLLIVCRGGGSLEDLWAFNDERVVRAVAACTLPVICGVGHETDVTLADFAADLRAPTPTAAAELAAPARSDCLATLQAQAAALRHRMQRALDTQRQRVDRASLRLARPADLLRREGQGLAMLSHRLDAALRQASAGAAERERQAGQRLRRAAAVLQAQHHQRLEAIAARLALLDPRQVLARGYAWLSDAQGAAVMSVARLATGQALTATLADGRVSAEVLAVESMPLPQAGESKLPTIARPT